MSHWYLPNAPKGSVLQHFSTQPCWRDADADSVPTQNPASYLPLPSAQQHPVLHLYRPCLFLGLPNKQWTRWQAAFGVLHLLGPREVILGVTATSTLVVNGPLLLSRLLAHCRVLGLPSLRLLQITLQSTFMA